MAYEPPHVNTLRIINMGTDSATQSHRFHYNERDREKSAKKIGLVIANIETVSKFIYITHIRFGLLIFLLSVILTVLANYLSAIVKVALAAQDNGDAIGKSIAAQTTELDLSRILDEYRRGLLPPVRWIAESSINKVLQGDIVAGARLIAKLSQVQALLVLAQGLLAIVAVAALAFGLKLE